MQGTPYVSRSVISLRVHKEDQKTAHVFNFQTTMNLTKQLITFLKIHSQLQINVHGWGICSAFVNRGLIKMLFIMVNN